MLGTFSEYAVVSEYSVIPIPDDIPFEVAALVGCGVPTGWGSAVHAAGVRAGETVVVFGAGGVGSNAVQGAAVRRRRSASSWSTRSPFKREMATRLRCDAHLRHAPRRPPEFVNEVTWGELADHAIITVGVLHDEVIADALKIVGKTGQVTVTAVGNGWVQRAPRHVHRLPAADPGRHLRRLQPAVRRSRACSSLYRTGDLKLDELITRTYRLEDVNQGYQDMLDGKNIRGVIIHEH